MRVFMIPFRLPGNKYIEWLVRSLRDAGAEVERLPPRRLLKPRRGDIVHLHWPSYLYEGENAAATGVKSVLFLCFLLYLRVKGVRLVWTVHNLFPHGGNGLRRHRLMRTLLCRFCSRILVFGETSKASVMREFKADPGKLATVPHGHYREAYRLSGADIRSRHGIPADDYLFLFIGRLSPYKGVDRLLDAFEKMGDSRTRLLIAGEPADGFDVSSLKEAGGRVHVSIGFVKDEELADYVTAANAVVLPYRQITTSGTAILALSFERPVIAPDIGLLRDYLGNAPSLLYDPAQHDALTLAMHTMHAESKRFSTAGAYEEKLRELDWSAIARLTLAAYRGNDLRVGEAMSESLSAEHVGPACARDIASDRSSIADGTGQSM